LDSIKYGLHRLGFLACELKLPIIQFKIEPRGTRRAQRFIYRVNHHVKKRYTKILSEM